MNRRRLLLVLGVFALGVVVVGVAFVAWDRNRPGVTWANYEKIQEGMTLFCMAQVIVRKQVP